MQSQIKPNALLRYRRYNREHNFIFGGHSHANWEIDIILKGTFEVTVDDSVLILHENTLILYESDVFHRSRIISKGRAEDVVIHFTCKTLPKNFFTGVYELSDTDMGLMQVLMEEAEKRATERDEFCMSADEFTERVKTLFEIFLERITENQIKPSVLKHPMEQTYRQAVTFMKQNLEKSLTISEIAKHCHVSDTKLKTIFQHFTGTGIISYFSSLKISEAKKLLKSGASVYETSVQLGYSSQAYFSLCFKKATGMTPLQYKRA